MKKLEIKAANKHATTPTAFKPHDPMPVRAGRMLPMAWLMLSMLALSGCGGGDGSTCVGPACPTPAPYVPPEPVGYVGDDAGDYTYKYTSYRGYDTAANGYAPKKEYEFGYREPDCKYLSSDWTNFQLITGDKKSIVFGKYDKPSGGGDLTKDATINDVYAYRETYNFTRIDGMNMSFVHKISLYVQLSSGCSKWEWDPRQKKGEITRTGENTNKQTITNPNAFSSSRTQNWAWHYFLLQRTGSTLFTWKGKTILPTTGETVDMFEVDLPDLTDRKWDVQSTPDLSIFAGIDLKNKLFDGKTKAKALVHMKRSSSKSNPWYYDSIKIIMHPTDYQISVPLAEWQSFNSFDPAKEPENDYTNLLP
jgi:hypothetical protein